jgi:LysR family nitrogen assimilation transcriptional regulator
MELRQIKYFISVVRLKSVSKAARALNIAQPALSRHIQALEYQLRTPLLIRTPRGVVPTEAGKKLLELGGSLLDLVDQIHEEVEASPAEIRGDVVVGMPPSVSGMLAPTLITEVHQKYPKVSLRIMEGLSIFLEEWVGQGKIDVGVLTRPAATPNLELAPLVREQMVLVGLPGQMPPDRTEVRLAEIASLPYAMADGFHRVIEPLLTQLDVKLNTITEVNSVTLIKELVSSGLAFSIVPYGFVHKDVQNGLLAALPLVDPPVTRDLVLAHLARAQLSPAVKMVRQVIADCAVKLQVTASSPQPQPARPRKRSNADRA